MPTRQPSALPRIPTLAVSLAAGTILTLVRLLSAEELSAAASSAAQQPGLIARQVQAAFAQRLVATYGLSLVAALQTALSAWRLE